MIIQKRLTPIPLLVLILLSSMAILQVVQGYFGSSDVVSVPLTQHYPNNRSLSLSRYDIFWDIDDEYIHFAMSATATGWIGFGFYTGSNFFATMPLSDVIVGYIDEQGKAHIEDAFVPEGRFAQPLSDVSLGGTDDWQLVNAQYHADLGRTVFELKRKRITSDKANDIQFTDAQINGVTKVIYAYQSTIKPTDGFQDGSLAKHDLNLVANLNLVDVAPVASPSPVPSPIPSPVPSPHSSRAPPTAVSSNNPIPHESHGGLISEPGNRGDSSKNNAASGPFAFQPSNPLSALLHIALGVISLLVAVVFL